jgi:hypothetical protein
MNEYQKSSFIDELVEDELFINESKFIRELAIIDDELMIKALKNYYNIPNFENLKTEVQNVLLEYKKTKKIKWYSILIKILMRWFICMINLIAIYQIISVKNALFEELKDSFVSYWFKERRKKTFYKSIIDESIRNFPELDIFLFFQIFSEKFLNDCGFWTINLICYLINSIGLIFLIFFNFSNKYYSLFDFVILFITFFIMYFSLSIYSLIILEKCSEDTKNLIKKLIPSAIIHLDSKYKYQTYQLKPFKKNLKKLFEVISNSVNII